MESPWQLKTYVVCQLDTTDRIFDFSFQKKVQNNFHNVNASVFPSLSYKIHHDTTRALARVVSDVLYFIRQTREDRSINTMHYNILVSEGLQGTQMDALNLFNSKLMTLTTRRGL